MVKNIEDQISMKYKKWALNLSFLKPLLKNKMFTILFKKHNQSKMIHPSVRMILKYNRICTNFIQKRTKMHRNLSINFKFKMLIQWIQWVPKQVNQRIMKKINKFIKILLNKRICKTIFYSIKFNSRKIIKYNKSKLKKSNFIKHKWIFFKMC